MAFTDDPALIDSMSAFKTPEKKNKNTFKFCLKITINWLTEY